jgi:hypothetical protein
MMMERFGPGSSFATFSRGATNFPDPQRALASRRFDLREGRALGIAAILFFVASACGGGRPESPESLVREIFETLRTGNKTAFLSYLATIDDVARNCPTMTAAEKTEAQAELTEARALASESYDACVSAIALDGATFERADRSPNEVVTLRWHGCEPSLSFASMRVTFLRNNIRGSLSITQVIDLGAKWRFRGGVRLCEQRVQ